MGEIINGLSAEALEFTFTFYSVRLCQRTAHVMMMGIDLGQEQGGGRSYAGRGRG